MTFSNTESTITLRKELRAEIRNRRQALSAAEQLDAAKKMLNQLTKLNEIKKAQNIAIYLANDGEITTDLFINWCWEQGKNICLPVIHPFSNGYLLFLEYKKNSALIKNKYGINEPKLSVQHIIPLDEIDIIFTPLVAFDASGARLGMGGGFYDRTLASWYKKYKNASQTSITKPYPIGLAHDCQQVDSIPNECWDIPIPLIITPSQKINCS